MIHLPLSCRRLHQVLLHLPTVRLQQFNVVIILSHWFLPFHRWDLIRYFKDALRLCSCACVRILFCFASQVVFSFFLCGNVDTSGTLEGDGGEHRGWIIQQQRLNCVCYCFRRNMPVTFQALSERERKLWMEAMDGKEPVSLFLLCWEFCVVFWQSHTNSYLHFSNSSNKLEIVSKHVILVWNGDIVEKNFSLFKNFLVTYLRL